MALKFVRSGKEFTVFRWDESKIQYFNLNLELMHLDIYTQKPKKIHYSVYPLNPLYYIIPRLRKIAFKIIGSKDKECQGCGEWFRKWKIKNPNKKSNTKDY